CFLLPFCAPMRGRCGRYDAANHPGYAFDCVYRRHPDARVSRGEDAKQLISERLADFIHASKIQLDVIETLESMRDPLSLRAGDELLVRELSETQRNDRLVEAVLL